MVLSANRRRAIRLASLAQRTSPRAEPSARTERGRPKAVRVEVGRGFLGIAAAPFAPRRFKPAGRAVYKSDRDCVLDAGVGGKLEKVAELLVRQPRALVDGHEGTVN